MRILLCGYGGHMGREVRTCAERDENSVIAATPAKPSRIQFFGSFRARLW